MSIEDKALALATKYKTILKNAGIDTPIRLAHFFGQIGHESGLTPKEENLNYSGERLLVVFSKYFNEDNVDEYKWRPMMIANKVYGNRLGNGNMASGDGYKYRGRGHIQITGKENYTNLSDDTGIDFVRNPDLLLTEANSMVAAIWFWRNHNLNELADKDDIKSETRRINGGAWGYRERVKLINSMKEVFK